MIRLHRTHGFLAFVLFDQHGDGLPVEVFPRAWRRTRFPRDWRQLVRGAA